MNSGLHSVLRRQLAKAGKPDGSVDLDILVETINAFYLSNDREVRRINHANRLMSDEVEALLAASEVEALERRQRIADLERAQREIAKSEARNRHMAIHDALTGLPNRTLFSERLAHGLEQVKRHKGVMAVHCIDLDQFKIVNDTFGHQAGDELICATAQRFKSLCRKSDTIARLGGDEFAIVQLGTTANGAAELASRMIALLAEPFALSFAKVEIGCSVGITIVSDPNLEAFEALRQADLALYKAKSSGRGQYVLFEGEMDANVKTRRALQTELREALNEGKLSLVYQPQVDGNDRITGLEALCRWEHPVRGHIPPATFIPLAEESGLIFALGYFTLRKAFEDAVLWPDLKVAINISAHHLRMRDFIGNLKTMIRDMGVNPRQFELEITEGVLLGDDATTHKTLRALRALGFTLALDDFGTGYSSLSYLHKYPIDRLKIDRSFIANIEVQPESLAVISAIVRLADALKLSILAEGVENESQRRHLSLAGCTDIQGFLSGRPMSVNEIQALRARGRDMPGIEALRA